MNGEKHIGGDSSLREQIEPRHKESSGVPSKPIGFWSALRKAPWLLGLSIASAATSAALSIAPFWLIYRITVELFSDSPQMELVWEWAWWTLGLLALRWMLMAVSHVLAHAGAFAIQHRLRLMMARKLGDVPLSFFSGRGSGSLRRTLIEDVNSLEGFFAHMLPDAVSAACVPLAALALLFLADWRLALAALAPLPLALLAQWWFVRRGAERAREWSALQKRISNQVGEYVRGVQVIKSFGLDANSFGDLADAVRGAVDWVTRHVGASTNGWVLFVGVLSANLVVVAPLGAWLHAQERLDLPTYLLFLLVAPAVLTPLLRLTFAMGEQMQRAEALERINDILTARPLAQTLGGQVAKVQSNAVLDIEFKDLRHRYGDRLALDQVSFTARGGQVTALVGASGSGKSTLVRLVARLYEFESGSLTVGGLDVREWSLDELLARTAVVMQEVVLFHGTVLDNLRLAKPGASDAEIEKAARAAQAHHFIVALPQGYDTPLGERGARLSGGERQRLSIARALLKDAPIVLLDEATSSVDAENEALIQAALDALCQGRTVLMVGHRLRTTRYADHIVVMRDGRVAGQGVHDDLLRDCPAYLRLWNDHEQARDWSFGSDGVESGRAA